MGRYNGAIHYVKPKKCKSDLPWDRTKWSQWIHVDGPHEGQINPKEEEEIISFILIVCVIIINVCQIGFFQLWGWRMILANWNVTVEEWSALSILSYNRECL